MRFRVDSTLVTKRYLQAIAYSSHYGKFLIVEGHHMGRFQHGYIYEAFGAWHVRHYVTEIVDGKPTRVQKSHRLCAKDEKHHSKKCKAVQLECQKFMHKVNVGQANLDVIGDARHAGHTFRIFLSLVLLRVAANKSGESDDSIVDTHSNVSRINVRIPSEFVLNVTLDVVV